MPRGGPTRLYVGRLSSRTRSRDLEDLFNKYGRVRDVDLKHDFAFVEFGDPRDADEARHYLNGRDFEGSRLVVEFARRVRSESQGPRGPGGVREYLGRGPPPGTGRCYNCGNDGHWARDCKAGDWRDKCYRCGQRGHIERNCRNSPRAYNSNSRSRSRSRDRGRSRSRSYSRSRSRSVSRSPKRAGRSPVRSRSPTRSPPPKLARERRMRSRSRSLSPERKSRSPFPPSEDVASPVSSPPKAGRERRMRRSRSRSLSPERKSSRRSSLDKAVHDSPVAAAATAGGKEVTSIPTPEPTAVGNGSGREVDASAEAEAEQEGEVERSSPEARSRSRSPSPMAD